MALSRALFTFSALAAVPIVYGQGVIISAQGTKGSPASLALQVKTSEADANIINQAEIVANVVNECGRTLLGGNIDIGENTELQLSNKTVTSVTKGSTVTVAISQGDANGAGPYTCDLDLSSNADGVSGQTNLTVAETDGKNGDITLAVTMPTDLACVGASTGNVCTVRCFNSASAGPFGGCFAVQQTDITPKANTPSNIATAQTLEGIEEQVLEDQADLPDTLASNANSGGSEAEQGLAAVDALLSIDSTALATVAVDASVTAAADAAAATSTTRSRKTRTGKKNSTATAAAAAAGTAAANRNGAKAAANAAKANAAKANAANAAKANAANAANAAKFNGNNNKRAMRWGKRYVIPAVRPGVNN